MSEYKAIFANVEKNVNARRHKAIKAVVTVLLKVLLALGVFVGLKAIGFISGTFMVILAAVAVCVGTFNIGYIWKDIKY